MNIVICISILFYLTVQHGLLYTLPMSINRSMKLHSIYSILHILL